MKRQSNDFLRAKNMVVQDKFDFHQEQFSKDLRNFLSNYFQFDSINVEVCEGQKSKMVICVNISNVKKTHVV